jgi:hypothetical protein
MPGLGIARYCGVVPEALDVQIYHDMADGDGTYPSYEQDHPNVPSYHPDCKSCQCLKISTSHECTIAASSDPKLAPQ